MMWKWTAALAALAAGMAPAHAQRDAPPGGNGPHQGAGDPGGEAPDSDVVGDEVVVRGGRERGAVPGDIPPEQQLSPADIRAYGVSSLADLLTELEPQTRSARGRGGGGPVVLLNGRRISGFREIRDLPVEAIARVDILPEEVALKFGYRADQRVVNIVLRRRFRAVTTEAAAAIPTEGGNSSWRGQIGLLRIQRDDRVNLDVKYQGNSAILESERGIVPVAAGSPFAPAGNIAGLAGGEIDARLSQLAGTPVTVAAVPASAAARPTTLGDFVAGANRPAGFDATPYRSLVSPKEELTINGVYSHPLSADVTASFNLALEASDRESLLGLPGVTLTLPAGNPFSPFAADAQLFRTAEGQGPLRRSTAEQSYSAGFSLNGNALPWRWSLTGAFERGDARTITETGVDASALQARLDARDAQFNPFGSLAPIAIRPADTARSQSNSGKLDALVSGPLFTLPAGKANAALRLSAATLDYYSQSLRGGIARASDTTRRSVGAQANLDVPLVDRSRGPLGAIGDLSVNGNAEVERLSDFGTLWTYGYGLNWSPVEPVRLLVSVTDEQGAPSAQQLGDATLATPNVRVFDFRTGETASVTRITGGNPALDADHRNVLKAGLNWRIGRDPDVRFSADYVRTRIRDSIGNLPAATAEVEAAFPDRFVRDGTGRLVRIDDRAVNFARVDREELRWGFNFSMPLTSKLQKRIQKWRQQREAARAAGQPPARGGPFGGAFGREGRERWQRGGAQGGAPGGRPQPGGGEGAPPPEGGPPPPPSAGDNPGWRPGGGRFGGPGGGFGGPGGFAGRNGALAGRITASLYHTWRFRDQTRIRSGLPLLDALNGSATGNSGGTPRHEIEGQIGVSKDGFGLRLKGEWQSGTRVISGPGGSGETLRYAPKTDVDVRLFADLGQQLGLVRRHRWLIGTRVTLSVDNVFDARQRVTDSTGTVPLSFQPDLLDPVGRSVRLELRKLFF